MVRALASYASADCFTLSCGGFMFRYFSLGLLVAAVFFTSGLAGCASTSGPHALAGEAKATPNLNARFPTLPPL